MGLLDTQSQQNYYTGSDHGSYQFVSLDDVISQFLVVYVGEDKIIPHASRTDVAFHAQRALTELSFDTLKSFKAQEIIVQPSLQMILPQDYVNYTKISWVDSAGIKHLMQPTSKTSNPTSIVQDPISGVYSPFVSAFNTGLTTDTSNIGLGTNVTIDTTNNQADLTAVPKFQKLTFSPVLPEMGKKYILTYTISNVPYANPASTAPISLIRPIMFDEFGNSAKFNQQGTNGTYTQTVVLTTPTDITHTSTFYFQVDTEGAFTGSISDITLAEEGDIELNIESATWASYKAGTPSENQDDYQDDTYWPAEGSRFGLDPQHAQANGSFYIDQTSGKIHFSSNISGKTVILDYISDSLGTDGEMQVHKFAEEAMYKWITHALLAGRANVPEYQVNRFKKERFAAIRTAKLRLSNLKLEELTQILRGKSKQIKH